MAEAKQETIMQKMSNLAYEAEKMPIDGLSADIAGALTILADVEKALRKKRTQMMATLIKKAGQKELL